MASDSAGVEQERRSNASRRPREFAVVGDPAGVAMDRLTRSSRRQGSVVDSDSTGGRDLAADNQPSLSAGRPYPRVLHVRTTHGRHGPERALIELGPALMPSGLRASVLALHRPRGQRAMVPPTWLDEAQAAGFTVHHAADPAAASPAAARAIRRVATSHDLIHTHDYRADLLVWALKSAGLLTLPWVATVHLHSQDSARLRLWRRLDRRALRAADAVLTVSADQRDALAASGIHAGRIHLVPNAIDAAAFSASVGDTEALRARLRALQRANRRANRRSSLHSTPRDNLRATLPDPDHGRPLIVFVGRLTAQKGVDVLLNALPAILARHPSACVVIAGDGPERVALDSEAARIAPGGNVIFLGTVLDVATLLAAADVVVLPSRREGLPLVLLEAMAVGAPIVATPVGGVPAVVADRVSALLVPPDDPAALATAIDTILRDGDLAATIGAAAARAVRADFAPAPVAAELAAIYRDVLEAAR